MNQNTHSKSREKLKSIRGIGKSIFPSVKEPVPSRACWEGLAIKGRSHLLQDIKSL